MARVQNLGNRKRGVSLSMQRSQNQKTEAFRAYFWAMFIRILENTPQFSGMAVANWNVSIGAPDFSYDPSLGVNVDWKTVGDSAPHKKGDRFWIDHAIRRNQAVLDSIKPGDKVFITNKVRSYKVKKGEPQLYLEDMQVELHWRKKLRYVNRPYEVAEQSAAEVARLHKVGQRLPNYRKVLPR